MGAITQAKLREYGRAREALRATFGPAERLIEAAEAVVAEALAQARVLEELRPVWAQGFSDDSMAAQANGNALAEIWKLLGVDNQTAAMGCLRKLVGGANAPA